ncbi:MAG: hypothetical protein JXA77_06010 [Bacteroidales bacterium]|nr:hypothetical protein [Bacteroidales bacterium]MBN2820593.1 hypothetical protein [Bacteroidales bacterium]
MMPDRLLKYIENPGLLNESSIIDITLMAEQYPYFQAAQLLRVKNLHNISPENIKPVLSFAAAFVTDRKNLYYLLHPIQSLQAEIKVPKSPEKEVKDTIGENISDMLDNQVKYFEESSDEEIEFSASMNLKKEYGKDIKLDDLVIRINKNEGEFFELIDDNKIEAIDVSIHECKPESAEKDSAQTNNSPKQNTDILSLINKTKNQIDLPELSDIAFSESQKKNNELINKFIQTNPKIVPTAEKIEIKDISEDSVKENEHLITDTLAGIYVKQGNYAKAIFAYEKLSLKYPEKSTYFAGQIAEIKKLIEKNK